MEPTPNPIINSSLPLCLAPMVGLSHVVTRAVIQEYIPEGATTIWPTEMLNSRHLMHENLSSTPETLKSVSEVGLVPQILANEEYPIAQAVQKLEKWGAAGIDINMGCPVSKALKHNYGVALMGDPAYAAQIVRWTKKSTSLPVSVKLRAGLNSDPDFLLRFCEGLIEAGADWLCLHPRTASQKRRGHADWTQIELVKKNFGIPLIGNGDIQVVDDVYTMLAETQCDMVMSGRALCARPWMFWQLGQKLGLKNPAGLIGSAPMTPEEEGKEFYRVLIRWIYYSRIYFAFNENYALRKLQFFLRITSPWLVFGHNLHARVLGSKTLNEAEDQISFFFAQSQEMQSYTDLRI